MYPVKIGETIPGMLAKQFEIPNRIDAYFGAISRWLTAKPDSENPPTATPMVSSKIV